MQQLRGIWILVLVGLAGCSAPPPDLNTGGVAELIGEASSSGAVSRSLSFELEGAVAGNFKAAGVSGTGLDYIASGFKLKTAKGGSLKAVGIIYPPTGVALNAKGELDMQGTLVDLGRYKAIRGVATLRIPSGGATTTARAALLIVGDGVFFDEADALFGKVLSLGKPNVVNLTNGSLFSYSAANESGSTTVGIGLADIRQKPGLVERQTYLGFFAESVQTPYGKAKRLTGAIDGEKDSVINVLVLALRLEQPKPQKSVVVACENCRGDVVLAASEKSFVAWEDIWPQMTKRPPIPTWVTGQSAIPFPQNPTCKDLAVLMGTVLHAADDYARYSSLLARGSDLALVNRTITQFKAGSVKHQELRDRFSKARASSRTTATAIAARLNTLKCYAQ